MMCICLLYTSLGVMNYDEDFLIMKFTSDGLAGLLNLIPADTQKISPVSYTHLGVEVGPFLPVMRHDAQRAAGRHEDRPGGYGEERYPPVSYTHLYFIKNNCHIIKWEISMY